MNWYFILWLSWGIFDLWTAAIGPPFVLIAIWRRFVAEKPAAPNPRQSFVDWSLVGFTITTLAAWASLAFQRHGWHRNSAQLLEASCASGLASLLALVISSVFAIWGRGAARKVLLAGQIVVSVGGVAGLLYALHEKHFQLGPW